MIKVPDEDSLGQIQVQDCQDRQTKDTIMTDGILAIMLLVQLVGGSHE